MSEEPTTLVDQSEDQEKDPDPIDFRELLVVTYYSLKNFYQGHVQTFPPEALQDQALLTKLIGTGILYVRFESPTHVDWPINASKYPYYNNPLLGFVTNPLVSGIRYQPEWQIRGTSIRLLPDMSEYEVPLTIGHRINIQAMIGIIISRPIVSVEFRPVYFPPDIGDQLSRIYSQGD